MIFQIVLGIPDVENYWNDLSVKFENEKLSGKEKTLFAKLVKALKLLETNPRSNSLATRNRYIVC